MSNNRKPLYLLADSQLLFCNLEGNRFISSLRESLDINKATLTKAAYIGASNGDQPEFFDLFVAAMEHIDTHESKMIRANFPDEDKAFLQSADLILLAGGEVEQGWDVIKRTGMDEIISERYYAGATVVGISAGAIQLGMGASSSDGSRFIDTLRLVPYYIGVHEEKDNWARLKQTVMQKEQYNKGFGIPSGAGMIYCPDLTIEPVRYPLNEISKTNSEVVKIVNNILLPPETDFPAEKTNRLEN